MYPLQFHETKIKVSMKMIYTMNLIYASCAAAGHTFQVLSSEQTLDVYVVTKPKHRLHLWLYLENQRISWFLVVGLVVEMEKPTLSIVRHFNKEPRSSYWLCRCCVIISGHGCHVNQKKIRNLSISLLRPKLIEEQTNKLLGCAAVLLPSKGPFGRPGTEQVWHDQDNVHVSIYKWIQWKLSGAYFDLSTHAGRQRWATD